MQIAVGVTHISLAEWYATLGPHLFHFKSLGLLAVSLDNDNAGVSIIQVNVTGRSVNMIQHYRHFGDKHLLNHCYIYIYIILYAFGICAAVDFSYDMTYSGTGTMLHLAELV